MNSLISPKAISDAWKNENKLRESAAAPAGEYVDVGLFADRSEAGRVMSALAPLGKVDLSEVNSPDGLRIALIARTSAGKITDALLQAAWKAGAGDAFVVRDDGN
jgi:rare lipoprotein A